MEKERFREREPEPRKHDYAWNDERYVAWAEEKKLFDMAPRVRRFDDVPWEQVYMAYHKIFTGANMYYNPAWLERAPIYGLPARLQILQPGKRSGKHRHFSEAMFYILEGKGYEIHDDKRYDWEAGDVMCVPSYTVHQHIADPEVGATIFYTGRGNLMRRMGLGCTEQKELHRDYKLPKDTEPIRGSEGELVGYRHKDGMEIRVDYTSIDKEAMERKKRAARLPGKIETTYDEYIKAYWEESNWRQNCPHVVKSKDLPWEDTRQGRIKYVIHPKIPSGILTYECFLQEIPPGGRSGLHRHVGEEVHFIIEGEGYDVLDGVRWDWKKNDVVCIPVVTTHQQFNSNPDKPVLFVSFMSSDYNFIGHSGIEHLEDAWP